jgi:heat shock protein HslJ
MVALVLGAGGVLAGCGDTGPSDSKGPAGKLEERAGQRGFGGRQVETYVLASESCEAHLQSGLEDMSATQSSESVDAHAFARTYVRGRPPDSRPAAFEGCSDGLTRALGRPPPSTSTAEALWGRSFIATSADGLAGKPDPPVERPPQIRLSFVTLGPRDEHAIGWKARCNSHGGKPRIRAQTIEVKNVSSTAVGCGNEREAEEEWLFRFMKAMPEWRLAGTRLVLMASGAKIEFRGLERPDSCPISRSGGRIDLGSGALVGCEGALDALSLYGEKGGRYLQGWECSREEQAEGLDRVRCQDGKMRFTAEGFDLDSLRSGP